jgi:hypothetical protein
MAILRKHLSTVSINSQLRYSLLVIMKHQAHRRCRLRAVLNAPYRQALRHERDVSFYPRCIELRAHSFSATGCPSSPSIFPETWGIVCVSEFRCTYAGTRCKHLLVAQNLKAGKLICSSRHTPFTDNLLRRSYPASHSVSERRRHLVANDLEMLNYFSLALSR